MMPTERVKLLEPVRLEGTVVEVYDDGAEVEISDGDGRGVAFLYLTHEALAQRLPWEPAFSPDDSRN